MIILYISIAFIFGIFIGVFLYDHELKNYMKKLQAEKRDMLLLLESKEKLLSDFQATIDYYTEKQRTEHPFKGYGYDFKQGNVKPVNDTNNE